MFEVFRIVIIFYCCLEEQCAFVVEQLEKIFSKHSHGHLTTTFSSDVQENNARWLHMFNSS